MAVGDAQCELAPGDRRELIVETVKSFVDNLVPLYLEFIAEYYRKLLDLGEKEPADRLSACRDELCSVPENNRLEPNAGSMTGGNCERLFKAYEKTVKAPVVEKIGRFLHQR